MRIIHVISGLKNGGAEAVLFRVITDETSNVHHEVISLSDEGHYGGLIESKGIKVTTLNISSFPSLFSSFFKLIGLIKAAKPDTVQTWMYHADILGGLAAKFLGIKEIFWGVHSTFLSSKDTKLPTKIAVYLSTYLSYVIPKKIICCSNTAFISHKKIGFCVSKMIVINNGFDLNFFKPDVEQRSSMRESLGILNQVFLLGMVARWHPVKDHETFLNALKNLKSSPVEWKCLLVGDGIVCENNQLMSLIKENGLENLVLCLGSRQDLPSVLNALDLHVLSSSSESFGNVTAEAMACTIPCIMTDVGEAKNMLSELGWLVPIGDSIKLYQTIELVLSEFQKCEIWTYRKKSCRKLINNCYNIDKMISSYIKVWTV